MSSVESHVKSSHRSSRAEEREEGGEKGRVGGKAEGSAQLGICSWRKQFHSLCNGTSFQDNVCSGWLSHHHAIIIGITLM